MIRVAVLGCGYWGPNLLRNFSENPSFHVVACADVDPTRFVRLVERYPTVCFTTELAQILRDPNIDAVAICTPADTHHALACAALQHGKHVLVEKPLATTVAHAEDIVELADRAHLTLMVDHTYVYTGAVRKLRELVDKGELGEICYFDSVRINLGVFRSDVNVMWDLAPHDLSILHHILQKRPVAVSASGQAHVNSHVDVAYLTIYFDDALLAHFHCNWLAPVKVRTIIIGGSKRLVLYDDTQPSEKLRIYDCCLERPTSDQLYTMLVQYRLGDMYAPQLDTREALSVVCEHFAECITSGQEPLTGGAAGLYVVRVLEAAERSLAQDSRKVALCPT